MQERTPAGRFTARHDLRSLLGVVAAAAGEANPDAPARTTQRAYDAARAGAGHPSAPCAAQTAVRLGLGWRDVLDVALARSQNFQGKSIGRRARVEHAPWIGADDVRVSLRLVADACGQSTLSRSDYAAERERMRDEAARARRHYVEPPLLTDAEIRRVTGCWNEALAIAGLEARPRGNDRGLPFVDAIELCLEAHGALPDRDDFRAFAKANRIRIEHQGDRRWSDLVASLRRRREREGKWTPPAPLERALRPDFTEPVALEVSAPEPLPTRAPWTREECLEALAELLRELGESTYLTQKLYLETCRKRQTRSLPGYGTLQRFGKFNALVAEARERLS